ncbi:hypothetical protein [Brevundimonas sp. A19_0]|uniref:hypothetical protein n=1 Tax=Brevundimonas sp. A19_0 TaxID=2821087 RepID=UPI001ADA7986|nr:hypothetical protein [Brevundimonas sp. A19_0]MBO9502514.1 hypothetical protein [Brevundimonas sp. A19_0]
MGKVVSFINGFIAGEIGPTGWERSDLVQHAKGCALALNMVALVTGPLVSRGGFRDRGPVADETVRGRLVGFARSSDDALILELGDEEARVWTPDGSLIMDGSDPYVFALPWDASQLDDLWFRQIGDVLFVTDRTGGRTRTIRRLADDDWAVADLEFREGPWLPEGQTISLTPSGVTGAITLNAGAAAFEPADVGSRLRIRQSDGQSGYDTWTSATDYDGGKIVQYDGKVYQRQTPGGTLKSGTTPPLHESGVVSDGKLDWLFLHDGAGVVRITAYTSPTQVSGIVETRLPSATSTIYWAKSGFSDVQGWPRALAEEREERLVFGATTQRPGQVDMTRTSGFTPTTTNFKPGYGSGRVVSDNAVSLNVGGASRVVWLASAAALIAGCTDGEYVLSGATLDDPITPDGRTARKVSSFGSGDVAPLMLQGPPPTILHVLRSRTVIREVRVSPDQSVDSRDLSVLREHVMDRGIAEMAFQQPDNIVWMRLGDGGLAALVYHLEQQVLGIYRQSLPEGWTVESLVSVPTPTGGDRVAIQVSRVKDEVTQRRVWLLAPRSDGMFLDGSATYEGTPVTTVSGLDWRAGETVSIVADGARVPDQVVSEGGTVTVPDAAGKIVVGDSIHRRFESLPLDMAGPGSTNAVTLIPTHATVILDAVEADVGTLQEGSMDTVRTRTPDDLAAPGERRVRERVAIGNGADRDQRLVIETRAPFDLGIYAYRLEAEANR